MGVTESLLAMLLPNDSENQSVVFDDIVQNGIEIPYNPNSDYTGEIDNTYSYVIGLYLPQLRNKREDLNFSSMLFNLTTGNSSVFQNARYSYSRQTKYDTIKYILIKKNGTPIYALPTYESSYTLDLFNPRLFLSSQYFVNEDTGENEKIVYQGDAYNIKNIVLPNIQYVIPRREGALLTVDQYDWSGNTVPNVVLNVTYDKLTFSVTGNTVQDCELVLSSNVEETRGIVISGTYLLSCFAAGVQADGYFTNLSYAEFMQENENVLFAVNAAYKAKYPSLGLIDLYKPKVLTYSP